MELSIKESVKTIVKSSQRNFLFITFILLLPLSLFQVLFLLYLLKILTLVSNGTDKSMIFSYFIYNSVYLVLFLTFYLLSTSSMIFTMASLYVSKPVSCISTLFAIPRLSKRILITFLYALPLMISTYLANFAFVYMFFNVIKMNSIIAWIFVNINGLFLTYVDANVIVLWNLANVISVLEPNVHGLSAMKMSKQFLRGSPYYDATGFVYLYCMVASVILFIENLAVFMDCVNYYIIARILLAFCVIIMAGVNLVGLVGQSVLYYACKNYHNQVIDKEVLYAHLAGKESGNKEV